MTVVVKTLWWVLWTRLVTLRLCESKHYVDKPCQWKSLTGASYDLQPLTITDQSQMSYFIKDGDIPCTPDIEPTYSYVWNLCAPVTEVSFPRTCALDGGASDMSAAIQFLNRSTDGYKECEQVGQYDPDADDLHFKQLDLQDPSKGVSITYPLGDKCGPVTSSLYRSATIDVVCSDIDVEIESATEPSMCEYHFTMKSYYGCPLSCPVTTGGLCNSHGHCAYDPELKKARCFCNEGYAKGDSCQSSSTETGGGLATNTVLLMDILIAMLVITLILAGFMGYLAYSVMKYREVQMAKMAGKLSSQAAEMPEGTEMTQNVLHGGKWWL